MEINIHDPRQSLERLTGDLVGKARQTPYGLTCALCGQDLEWESCSECGGEGGHDGHELDPLWYHPGELATCGLCSGEGGAHWGHLTDCPTRYQPLQVLIRLPKL